MQKLFLILSAFIIVLASFAQPALAGGDKVRGDDAQGPANQLGECPFIG